MARLDRLAPVKEVAQIGAVIGREFSHELLAAVAPMSANRLGDALEQLVSSELVFRHGTPPEATYTFKHALVQDAAYQSLLKSKRQGVSSSTNSGTPSVRATICSTISEGSGLSPVTRATRSAPCRRPSRLMVRVVTCA